MDPHAPDLRTTLRARVADARARTDELFAMLRPDALLERPIGERHRLIFYLGHVEAFDWNLLGRDAFGERSPEPSLDALFAFGIDPLGAGLPADAASDWPSRGAVERYARERRAAVDRLLDAAPLEDPTRPALHRGHAFELAIEHRLMHAETLAYLLHQLPFDRKRRPAAPDDAAVAGSLGPRRSIEIPAGVATLGRPRSHPAFGWDNEREQLLVDVPAFRIDEHPVTHGDFLAFVEAGGYEARALWSDADWAWQSSRGVAHPTFWARGSDGFRYRSMFEELPLPLDRPVYVSHAEATAYARWKGKALPTEADWHRAALGAPDGRERAFPWGDEPPSPRRGAFDFSRWDPTPIGAHPDGASAFGVADLVGNGWEWTSSVFAPFPGFAPSPLYRGYSADFFDGRHFVLKGGSTRTAACMLRSSFRNWFQAHYPYVYAKLRLVER